MGQFSSKFHGMIIVIVLVFFNHKISIKPSNTSNYEVNQYKLSDYRLHV